MCAHIDIFSVRKKYTYGQLLQNIFCLCPSEKHTKNPFSLKHLMSVKETEESFSLSSKLFWSTVLQCSIYMYI